VHGVMKTLSLSSILGFSITADFFLAFRDPRRTDDDRFSECCRFSTSFLTRDNKDSDYNYYHSVRGCFGCYSRRRQSRSSRPQADTIAGGKHRIASGLGTVAAGSGSLQRKNKIRAEPNAATSRGQLGCGKTEIAYRSCRRPKHDRS